MCPDLGSFQSYRGRGFLFLRTVELIEDSGGSGGNCQRIMPTLENHQRRRKKSPLLSKLLDPAQSDARS